LLWLQNQRCRPDEVGAFARAVHQDVCWPQHPFAGSRDYIRHIKVDHGPDTQLMGQFKTAWLEYART
jgi:hypothetical protein